MKKFSIILLFILTLSVFSVFSFGVLSHNEYQNIPNLADSGFDGDYGDYDSGGSSWGGGSSYWDDDDDDYRSPSSSDRYSGSSSGSGEPADPITVLYALLLMGGIFAFIFTIKGLITRANKQRKHRNYINDTLIENFGLNPGDGRDDQLVQTAYENYVKIQIAWMNRDLTPVKHLLSDEIYNMYQMQLDTLIEDNQINVMSHFQFYCGKVRRKTTQNNIQTIKITLCVKCRDYIIKAHNRKVVSGKRNATITYIYGMTFVRDLNKDTITNCPTCGAVVKKQMSATCKYCKNPLLLTSPEITLTSKTVEKQFRDK